MCIRDSPSAGNDKLTDLVNGVLGAGSTVVTQGGHIYKAFGQTAVPSFAAHLLHELGSIAFTGHGSLDCQLVVDIPVPHRGSQVGVGGILGHVGVVTCLLYTSYREIDLNMKQEVVTIKGQDGRIVESIKA